MMRAKLTCWLSATRVAGLDFSERVCISDGCMHALVDGLVFAGVLDGCMHGTKYF